VCVCVFVCGRVFICVCECGVCVCQCMYLCVRVGLRWLIAAACCFHWYTPHRCLRELCMCTCVCIFASVCVCVCVYVCACGGGLVAFIVATEIWLTDDCKGTAEKYAQKHTFTHSGCRGCCGWKCVFVHNFLLALYVFMCVYVSPAVGNEMRGKLSAAVLWVKKSIF